MAGLVFSHPVAGGLNGLRREEPVVRLFGVENESLHHEVRSFGSLEMPEAFCWAADYPVNRGNKFALTLSPVDLVPVPDWGIFLKGSV